MEDSILKTIRKMLGPDGEYDYFDPELIVYINSALSKLTQIGVGPEGGFSITGPDEAWSDFYQDDKLSMVKDYVYLKTKIMFDPPLNASVLEAFKQEAAEDYWRLGAEVS